MRKVQSGRQTFSESQEAPATGDEPVYAECDENGDAIRPSTSRRPKWQSPNSDFQRKLLAAVGRKYYLQKQERSRALAIEKAMMSLETGVASSYPLEWVNNCIEWAEKKRAGGTPIQLAGLLGLIQNSDRESEFVAKWTREHGPAKKYEE